MGVSQVYFSSEKLGLDVEKTLNIFIMHIQHMSVIPNIRRWQGDKSFNESWFIEKYN